MPTKSTNFVIGRAGFARPSTTGATPSTATPLVERLMNSAANAEELLEGGIELSGSDEEVLALLRNSPIISD